MDASDLCFSDLIVDVKPKEAGSKLNTVARKLGFHQCLHANTTNMHIWLFWEKDVLVTLQEVTSQSLTVEVNIPTMYIGKITIVYARCSRDERVDLWDHLVQVSSNTSTHNFVEGCINGYKTWYDIGRISTYF